MHEYIKKRVIKDLISEIDCLGAIELELVGCNLVGIREGQRLVHHGINNDYKPVGYTVDSFTSDSLIVSEYSTEQDYFKDYDKSKNKENPAFPKIEKDIKHALAHKKPDGPEKIYLITNQEEPPSFRAKFNATTLGQTYGEKIVFLDAREMANEIYAQSAGNADYASAYKQFFPGFSQFLDNYEYYGKLPAPCEGHVVDQGIRGALANHFRKNIICVLHGVSGSGKTQAAIDFVRHLKGEFQNYVWISGEDWPKDTSFEAIQRSRGGTPINVAGLFNYCRTILVIDSLERGVNEADFGELRDGFEKGGVVIVTSQSAILEKEKCLPIPELSAETAARILGEDLDAASKTAREFIQACRFSPLILSTARNIILQEQVPSDDLYRDVLSSPESVAGRDGQLIMSKILSRLNGGALQALKQIANSGETKHDIIFLRKFIGIINAHRLQQLSILLPTSTPGVAKIHDLVCMAVRDNDDGQELAIAIEKFIEQYNGEMTPSVLRQIHLGYKHIYEEHIRRCERSPDWIVYALLQVEGDVKQTLHEQIHSIDISPGLPLSEVMSLIDAKETHAYEIENQGERREYYRQCAAQFEGALAGAANEDVIAELLHHRGKALRRSGDYEDALNCFRRLLDMRPGWHATHGQIAHLGMQYGVDEHIKAAGEQSMRVLTHEMIEDASLVPLRVSLAALARLRSYGKVVEKLSQDPAQVSKLADVIALSALEGFGQFYEAFVSFTSKFGYPHPSICVDLAEQLPEMLVLPPEFVEKRQWVSACEALSNTAISARKEGKAALCDRLIQASLLFANAIASRGNLKGFDARAVAKTYLNAGLPQRALEVIGKVTDDQISHWVLYRKAEAELAIEAFGDALSTAQSAFDLADKDPKAKSHISSYHKLLSEIYERLGDMPHALLEAEYAVNKCVDGQFKEELVDRVSTLKGMSA